MQPNPFDDLTDRYDAWYDSDEGREIFAVEVACLRPLVRQGRGRWLEVGVGTGRFAEALGIADGVDTSLPMLRRAVRRRIRAVTGRAESLPYLDSSLDGVLVALTICFLDDARSALCECARVLKEGSPLIVGMVPADSPLGRFYRRKGQDGHPFYAIANFYGCEQLVLMAGSAGFVLNDAMSCLLGSPHDPGEQIDAPRPGLDPEAGFVALRFRLGEKAMTGGGNQPRGCAEPHSNGRAESVQR
jgi:SAM-dependent methyltransferase